MPSIPRKPKPRLSLTDMVHLSDEVVTRRKAMWAGWIEDVVAGRAA